MPYKKPPIAVGINANQTRKCKAGGCTKARHRISGYCNTHSAAFHRLGHPLARTINLGEYASERLEVQALVDSHRDHVGIRAGLGFTAGLLSGVAIPNCPVANERLARLRGHVTPEELLIEIAGIFVFSRHNWGKRVFSDLNELHVLGNKVLTYGKRVPALCDPSAWPPNEKLPKARGKDFRAVGMVIMQGIGVLLLNIERTLQKQSQARAKSLLSQGKEIEI